MIPNHIKEAVRAKLLADLDYYWKQAEEMEDDPVQLDDAGARLKDFYLYQHTKTIPLNGAERVYIVAHDGYFGLAPDMYEFTGTYRQLLERMNGVDEENRDDPFPIGDEEGHTIKDLTDKQLVEIFDNANGDGQPWYMVYDLNAHKVVLGGTKHPEGKARHA